MEARRADSLPEGDGWIYEPKWDGFRCLAFRAGNRVELLAKSGKPLHRYFPELVEAVKSVPQDNFVVDGEIVIERGGKTEFDALQMRLHPAESRISKLALETPAELVLFDMLADPEAGNLLALPLSERRNFLTSFVEAAGSPSMSLSRYTADLVEAQRWLTAAGEGSTDGVVAKRLDDPYRPGERAMVKVKRLRTADCVVGGFRYLAARQQVGSLLLGLYDDNGLLNHVGFTSTIANEERAELTARLEALREEPGFTGRAPGGPSRWSTERSGQWVPLRPQLVVEVLFDHVTGERFRHGTRLVRWRSDKAPRQCRMDQLD